MCPRELSKRPQGDDVPEAVAVLQLLGHGLGGKHKTIVILKRIHTRFSVQLTPCTNLELITAGGERAVPRGTQMNLFVITRRRRNEWHYRTQGPGWRMGLGLTGVINTPIQFHSIKQNHYLTQREQ